MKALTIYEPFATLLLLQDGEGRRIKRYETRPKSCTWLNYRGDVAIHAAKCQDLLHLADREPFKSALGIYGITRKDLVLAHMIGTAKMTNVVDAFTMPAEIIKREGKFGDFGKNRVAIRMDDPMFFKAPISARGRQGLWNWDGEIDGKV